MTILERIIAYKKKELAVLKKVVTVGELERGDLFKRNPVSLSEFLLNTGKTGIIAEFKRKSPSRGIINYDANVVEVTSGYFREGASGVSVLTDNNFFGGSATDLINARSNSNIPLLRKDFTIDEFQIIESKAIGADAILLIAAVLTKNEIMVFARLARTLGLEVLLEIHEPLELEKVNQYGNIIGVNNRNLKTFEVDTDTSVRIADNIPREFIKISESGINSSHIIRTLKTAGYTGFLMGEAFMSADDPVKAFKEFVGNLI